MSQADYQGAHLMHDLSTAELLADGRH